MRFKEQITKYLEHHGLSQAALCKKCGIRKTTLNEWLKGRSPRNLDQVLKVAQFFNITVDHLLWGDGVLNTGTGKKGQQASPMEFVGVYEIHVRRIQREK